MKKAQLYDSSDNLSIKILNSNPVIQTHRFQSILLLVFAKFYALKAFTECLGCHGICNFSAMRWKLSKNLPYRSTIHVVKETCPLNIWADKRCISFRVLSGLVWVKQKGNLEHKREQNSRMLYYVGRGEYLNIRSFSIDQELNVEKMKCWLNFDWWNYKAIYKVF